VKILVCGANDIVFILDLCLCLFVSLDLFFFILGWLCCFCGLYFIINDLVYFIDWNIITLNCRAIIITFLFDWISLIFMGFIFILLWLFFIVMIIYSAISILFALFY
jgi:hypothetical protein